MRWCCDLLAGASLAVLIPHPIYYYIDFHKETRDLLERSTEARSCKHFSSRKAINITYSESFLVALGIQVAMRISHILLSYIACPAVQYFSALSHKRHDCRRHDIGHKMCILIFSTGFV